MYPLDEVLLLCLLAVLAGAAANAETYKLTDEKGRVQYTDRVPPDAVNRGMVELNKQGMPKNVTARRSNTAVLIMLPGWTGRTAPSSQSGWDP